MLGPQDLQAHQEKCSIQAAWWVVNLDLREKREIQDRRDQLDPEAHLVIKEKLDSQDSQVLVVSEDSQAERERLGLVFQDVQENPDHLVHQDPQVLPPEQSV